MNKPGMRSLMWPVLRQSLRGHRRALLGLGGWATLEAVPPFLSGWLVAQATDHGFLAHRPGEGFGWLGLLGVAIAVGAWANRQVFRRLAVVVEPFRDELAHMAVAGALQRSVVEGAPGEAAAVSRLSLQVEIAREAYAGSLMAVQGFVVTTAAALLGLVTLAPAVLPLVAVPLLVGLGIFAAALGRISRRQRASILAEERVAEEASRVAAGFRDVVACGGEELAAAPLRDHVDAAAEATQSLARFMAVRTIAVAAGGWLPIIFILLAGPSLIRRGATTGVILGALAYVLEGVRPALQTLVREMAGSGLWLFASLGRLVESAAVAESAPLPPATIGGAPAVSGLSPQELVLRNVSFRYGDWSEPVIDGLDLRIYPDDHLAIVGPSGAGKSTLAGVIAGMLVPQVGDVALGGTDLRRLGPQALSQLRVLIPQEAYVFESTLEENLSYLAPGVARERIAEAVDELGLHKLVELAGGYEATIRSSSLSAGERQLVTLARAYLSPADLVILDEATCHLDAAAEARVEEAFARRRGALVVVAHRMSSALRARRILVMDGTRIVVGTHQELMARSTLYRDLVGYWVVAS